MFKTSLTCPKLQLLRLSNDARDVHITAQEAPLLGVMSPKSTPSQFATPPVNLSPRTLYHVKTDAPQASMMLIWILPSRLRVLVYLKSILAGAERDRLLDTSCSNDDLGFRTAFPALIGYRLIVINQLRERSEACSFKLIHTRLLFARKIPVPRTETLLLASLLQQIALQRLALMSK